MTRSKETDDLGRSTDISDKSSESKSESSGGDGVRTSGVKIDGAISEGSSHKSSESRLASSKKSDARTSDYSPLSFAMLIEAGDDIANIIGRLSGFDKFEVENSTIFINHVISSEESMQSSEKPRLISKKDKYVLLRILETPKPFITS